ncbi:MAG: 3-dehydroquinate synthase II [Aquificaceae bacterium]|nr:3-dehydroquinate synthase II [Aquificaceae bacterium]MDW8236840.1 3-dehydroquinate synthase II [Aquificaceae bacterium]
MREFWYLAEPFDKGLVSLAIESGATVIVLKDAAKLSEVRSLGKILVACDGGDLIPERDFVHIEIKESKDQERAGLYPPSVKVLVETTDWRVIPLENLIAMRQDVYAIVKDIQEARLAFETLEKGVKGVVLKTQDPSIIKAFSTLLESEPPVELITAVVERILPIGLGDRVCVDTTSILEKSSGLLVGNSSSGMLLVHAETEESPYVASRPFRVNAGAVHMYVKVPGDKTKYLCELSSGDAVVIYDCKGKARQVFVGRSKIERRPMLLIEARYNNKKLSAILQNAETIRLVSPDCGPISVSELKPKMEVLGYVEDFARHFGMKIQETIQEK